MLVDKATLRTYQKIAPEYARRRADSNLWIAEYRTFKNLVKGKKVLDVGCGTGHEALYFAKDKFQYLGIDASPAMIKIARKLVPSLKFRVMDMTKLKLPKESFDGFWACASLLHIPRKKVLSVLKSLKKVLKPGGAGFISVKYKPRPKESLQVDSYPGLKRFFSYYNEASFKKLIKESGLKIVKFSAKINYRDPVKQRWLIFFVKNMID